MVIENRYTWHFISKAPSHWSIYLERPGSTYLRSQSVFFQLSWPISSSILSWSLFSWGWSWLWGCCISVSLVSHCCILTCLCLELNGPNFSIKKSFLPVAKMEVLGTWFTLLFHWYSLVCHHHSKKWYSRCEVGPVLRTASPSPLDVNSIRVSFHAYNFIQEVQPEQVLSVVGCALASAALSGPLRPGLAR